MRNLIIALNSRDSRDGASHNAHKYKEQVHGEEYVSANTTKDHLSRMLCA
jgi:hypothetical protein